MQPQPSKETTPVVGKGPGCQQPHPVHLLGSAMVTCNPEASAACFISQGAHIASMTEISPPHKRPRACPGSWNLTKVGGRGVMPEKGTGLTCRCPQGVHQTEDSRERSKRIRSPGPVKTPLPMTMHVAQLGAGGPPRDSEWGL